MKIIKYIYPIVCFTVIFLFFIIEIPLVILAIIAPCIIIGLSLAGSYIYNSPLLHSWAINLTIAQGIIFGVYTCTIHPLIISFFLSVNIGYALCIFLCCTITSIFLTNKIIKQSSIFKLIIISRKFTLALILILFSFFSILNLIGCFPIRIPFALRALSIVSLFADLLVLWRTIWDYSKHLYVFSNYLKPSYILYLRRFTFDNTDEDIKSLNILSNNKYSLDIMKVGNPKTFMTLADYSVFYLSTTNWQDILSNYIKNATLVFIQVDISDGIIWEIFNNIDHKNKYVYNITNRDDIPDIINSLNTKLEPSTMRNTFLTFLKYIDQNIEFHRLTFCIEAHKILFSSRMEPIIDYKINKTNNRNIQIFDIRTRQKSTN